MNCCLQLNVYSWNWSSFESFFTTPSITEEHLHTSSDSVEDALSYFLQTLTGEKLLELVGLSIDQAQEIFRTHEILADLVADGSIYAQAEGIIKEIFCHASRFFHQVMEILISVTGFDEIMDQKASPYDHVMSAFEGKMKLESYLALLGGPTVIFTTLFALLESAAVAACLTVLVVAVLFLAIPLYQRYLRPCPKAYQGLCNISQKVMQKQMEPSFARKDLLVQMENAFRLGKGVLLTGKSGVGKSTLIQSLAESIDQGTSADFLQGGQVFSVNAHQMKQHTWDGLTLPSIAEYFQWHTKQFVLFVDEVESIFQESGVDGKMDQMFLTFKDQFPYIICATTTEQYENSIKNQEPFMRRFVHIEIPPMSKEEIELALYEHVHRAYPEVRLEEEALSYIVEKALNLPVQTTQMDAAFSLLRFALCRMHLPSHKDKECLLHKKDQELRKIALQSLHGQKRLTKDEIASFEKKKHEFSQLKKELAQEKDDIQKIHKLEKKRFALEQTSYALAANCQERAWWEHQAHIVVLDRWIQQKRQKIGLPFSMNKNLVDTVLQEFSYLYVK
ncbi:MAG: AAA family ATPase [Chlamydiae bacterium]|nr:AAA family ATPase [Chlamydiota bacterium]